MEVANWLSMYLSSIFSDKYFYVDTPSLGIKSFDSPNNVHLTVENVYKHLSNLHGNWVVGADGLLDEFLCKLKNVIALSFRLFLSVRLKNDLFPSMLKCNSVVPVHKSSELSSISNYRLISFQSHIS